MANPFPRPVMREGRIGERKAVGGRVGVDGGGDVGSWGGDID